jgi:antitoxin PrlF
MKEVLATMTSKGQLTIPAEVRRQLGLKAGDRVVFHIEDHEVRLTPAKSRLAAGYQSIPALAEPKTWDEIAAIVREERAEADRGRPGEESAAP